MNKWHSEGGLTTGRIETLADGVFAIVMTLLVFNIKVPDIAAGMAGAELPSKLFELWPKFLTYLISFAVTGIYWIGHHNQFYYIRHTDRWLLWINILLLMFVALIPFSAALLGEYPSQKLSVDFYGANLIVTRLILYLNWWYATSKGHLVNDDIDPQLVKLFTRRILAAPILYLVAIAVSLINTDVTILLYALITIAYILPGRIDREWLTTDKVTEVD